MWRVSQILGESPFSPAVLNLTDAQMEFILTCYSDDNPKELQFVPARVIEEKMQEQSSNVGWANVLSGNALVEFLGGKSFRLPPQYAHGAGTVRRNPLTTQQPRQPSSRPSTRTRA